MMQLFRKYLIDVGERDWLNKFNAYAEAKSFLDQTDQSKKGAIGVGILKTYLDGKSRKTILPLSDSMQQKLELDLKFDARGNNRPRTPFCTQLVKEYQVKLEDFFQKFCEQQSIEYNLSSPESFALLNQTELLVLLGDNYNPKDFDFDEENGEGKLLASKEDKNEFLKILYDWSIGKYSDKFFSFYAHLSEHGKKDGMPFLEKDLMFCVDCIRLKEIGGDYVLRQKAHIMIEVYLDSTVPPSIQIDVSHEMHQKLYKSAVKIGQGSFSSNEISVFEEGRAHYFKELVPYWAGYKYRTKNGKNSAPITKEEKILRARLQEFMNMKNPSPNMFKLPLLSPRSRSITPLPHSNQKREQQQHQQQSLIPQSNQSHQNRHNHHTNMNIVFSIATGIRFKDDRFMGTGALPVTTEKNSVHQATAHNDRRMSTVSRNASSLQNQNAATYRKMSVQAVQ